MIIINFRNSAFYRQDVPHISIKQRTDGIFLLEMALALTLFVFFNSIMLRWYTDLYHKTHDASVRFHNFFYAISLISHKYPSKDSKQVHKVQCNTHNRRIVFPIKNIQGVSFLQLPAFSYTCVCIQWQTSQGVDEYMYVHHA